VLSVGCDCSSAVALPWLIAAVALLARTRRRCWPGRGGATDPDAVALLARTRRRG
jgi:hypothetical protein